MRSLSDLRTGDCPPTLTAEEVAPLFGCHVETLRALARQGRAPVTPLRLGRSYRWSTQKVLEALGISEREGAAGVNGGSRESIAPTAGQRGDGGDQRSDDHTT